MDSMFNYCSRLTSINLSNFDTSHTTNMASMFYYCYKLSSIDISSFTIADGISYIYMFYSLPSDGTITLKEEFKDKFRTIPSSCTKILV